MATVRLDPYPHYLGVQEAKRRLEQHIRDTVEAFGSQVSGLTHGWNGGVYEFSCTAHLKGTTREVLGAIEVDGQSFHVKLDIAPLGMLERAIAKKWIQENLFPFLDQCFRIETTTPDPTDTTRTGGEREDKLEQPASTEGKSEAQMEDREEVPFQEEEEPATRRRRFFSRGRAAAQWASGTVSSATGTFTGRGLEQAVAEYNEVYSQVLLGLHHELEEHMAQVQEVRKDVERAAALEERVTQAEAKVGTLRVIAIVALLAAFFAVVGVIWLAMN